MTKRFLQALHFQQSFITTFFFFALMASLGVALPELISQGIPHFLLRYPLTSSLIVYNYYSFTRVSYAIRFLPFSKYYPVILYGQCVFYFGVAYEFQDQGAAFLGILPALTGVIALSKLWTIGEREGEHRYHTYLYLLAITYGWFQISYPSFIDPSQGGGSVHYFLPIFFAQLIFMTLFPSLFYRSNLGLHDGMSFPMFIKKFMKESEKYSSFEKQDRKDRFFFHDMINHLYGLSLKLTYRISKGRGFEASELGDMLGEVMALQSLMSDHFGYKHKNIQNSFDSLAFCDLGPFIQAQIDSFLSDTCHVSVMYKGVLDSSLKAPFERPEVHFASFYRIFTNLLKNAREANAHNIEIIFEGDHHALSVTMKNDFQHLAQESIDLGEGLSRAIAGESEMVVDYKGLGLAAIENLCAEQGGSFTFEIKDGLWVNYFRINYAYDIAEKSEYERWISSNNPKIRRPKAA